MDEVSLEKARARLGDIADRAGVTRQPTLITRHGRPLAVVAPVFTADDRWLIAAAREAAAVPAGEGDPWEQLGRAKALLDNLADAFERSGG